MNMIRDFKWLTRLANVFFVLLLVGCGGSKHRDPIVGESPGASSKNAISSSQTSASAKSSLSSLAASSVKSSVASTGVASFNKVNISAPSLSANLIAEPLNRNLLIYLPKAYYTSTAPLPVIYYLPGFGDQTMLDVAIPEDLNTAFNTLHPSIIVVVEGVNRFAGSFFVDSGTTGNWAQFVLKDVVEYIDNNYRTIPNNKYRGIAGHSMGGFGALNLAMRHPEVFGSVFAISPGLVGSAGIVDTQMFDSPAHIKAFVKSIEPIKALSPADALSALLQNPEYFDMAYGMAFAPKSTPPFFEYPYSLVNDVLVQDDAILAKWEAGFGAVNSEVSEFSANLASLNGLGLDCGINDEYQWIKRGCDYFDTELSANHIVHTYTTHTGGHQDQLRKRILTVMLPFFSEHFSDQ